MTTKANNLLTAHVNWSMKALFETSQRENGPLEAIIPKYYKNCNLRKDVVAEKKIGDRWFRTRGIYKQVPPPGSLRPVLSGPLGI